MWNRGYRSVRSVLEIGEGTFPCGNAYGTYQARLYKLKPCFYLRVDSKVLGGYYGGLRTEEGIVELLVLLLRHHMPEEGIHPRRGAEETKVSWELQVGRIGRGEKVMESRASSQREVACCLCIKWWAITLLAVLMKKWPKQCNSQISSSFYHFQQMFKGTSVMMRIWLDRDEGWRCKEEVSI